MAIRSKKPKTIEKDYGFKGILKELRKLEFKPYVKIGLPRKNSETNETHGDSEFLTVLDLNCITFGHALCYDRISLFAIMLFNN